MRVYVASGLENIDAAKALIARLVENGHTISYDWTQHGSLQGSPDRWTQIAKAELDGVLTADYVVALMPGGRGTHTELGAALAFNKRVIIVGASDLNGRTCIFYHHPNVAYHVKTADEALLVVGR